MLSVYRINSECRVVTCGVRIAKYCSLKLLTVKAHEKGYYPDARKAHEGFRENSRLSLLCKHFKNL